MTRVVGDSGPAVLLLPGGAESVEGFFPGLAEGLVADPGCRVVLHDRPGTGSADPGLLADAADDLHRTIADLGVGPVVAVGQSLGGAVALLLASAHPEDVAGLVLLDPTPIHDPELAGQVARRMRQTQRVAALPGGGAALRSLLHATVRRSVRRHRMAPAQADAMRRTADLDVAQLVDAVVGLEDAAASLDVARLPRVPAVVVTADRSRRHALHRSHVRLADALDAPLVSWPRAEHGVHLTHPDEVLRTCRDVLGAVTGS